MVGLKCWFCGLVDFGMMVLVSVIVVMLNGIMMLKMLC